MLLEYIHSKYDAFKNPTQPGDLLVGNNDATPKWERRASNQFPLGVTTTLASGVAPSILEPLDVDAELPILGALSYRTRGKISFSENDHSYYDEVNERLLLTNMSAQLPSNPIHLIYNSAANASIRIDQFGGSNPPTHFMLFGRGTATSPTAVQSGDLIGDLAIAAGQYDSTIGHFNSSVLVRARATENFSSTAGGAALDFYTVKNTTTALNKVFVLDQDGSFAFPSDTAWSTYTPTITATTGTLTTVSATGNFKRIGRTIHLNIVITITTNGTGAGALVATLPVNAANNATGVGRENAVNGKEVSAILSSATAINIQNYDNTYPGVNGAVISVSITYEAAAAV